jgi:hypothetical protein
MAQIYTRVLELNGEVRERWVDLEEYKFTEGFLQWYSYRSKTYNKTFVCVYYHKDLNLNDWANLLARVLSGTAIGIAFGGPLGLIGGIIGFLSFLKGKDFEEGYYNTETKAMEYRGKILSANSSQFRL